MFNKKIVSISQEMILDDILSNDLIEVTVCKICSRRKLFKVKGTIKPIYIEFDRATGELKYLLREWAIPGICNTCLSERVRDIVEDTVYKAPLIPFKITKMRGRITVITGNRSLVQYEDKSDLEIIFYGLKERLVKSAKNLIDHIKARTKFVDKIDAVGISNHYWNEILILKILKSIIEKGISSKRSVENPEELISYFAFTEGLDYKYALETYSKRGLIINLKWDKTLINNKHLSFYLGKVNSVRGKLNKKGNYFTKCCFYRDVKRWVNVLRDGKLGISLKYGRDYPILVLLHKIGSVAWMPTKIKK